MRMGKKIRNIVSPWATATGLPTEPWTAMGITILEWPTEKRPSLSYGERLLYLCMVGEAKGKKCFEFSKSTAKKYGFPWSTACPAIHKLIDAGFIAIKEQGGATWGKNVYEFSDIWKSKINT